MSYKLVYKLILLISFGWLTGCLTMSGDYQLTAVDETGKPIMEKSKFYAQGRMIYSMRNGICANYPKATVHITDINTGKELKSESPYKCHGGIFN